MLSSDGFHDGRGVEVDHDRWLHRVKEYAGCRRQVGQSAYTKLLEHQRSVDAAYPPKPWLPVRRNPSACLVPSTVHTNTDTPLSRQRPMLVS